ncbi:MAG: J domain-containing protein [Oligoflexia bacterium]|nr:J domain-containing protein [Oligoflexia bacterium]
MSTLRRIVFPLFLLAHGVGLSSAAADDTVLCGLHFAVDEVQTIDAQSVKVTIGGQGRIIAKDQIEQYIAEAFFLDNARAAAFSADALGSFIDSCLLSAKPRAAAAALIAYSVVAPNAAASKVARLIAQTDQAKTDTEALSVFLKSVILFSSKQRLPSTVVAPAILKIGSTEPAWIKQNAPASVFAHSDEIGQMALEHFKQLVLTQQSKEIRVFVENTVLLLGSTDSTSKILQNALNRFETLSDALRVGQLAQLSAALQSFSVDPTQAGLLGPAVPAALHAAALKFIEEGNPEYAVRVLAFLAEQERTPQTDALVLRALSDLDGQPLHLAFDHQVADFLGAVSKEDSRVLMLYGNALLKFAYQLLNQGDIERAGRLIGILNGLGAGPANGEIETAVAVAYASQGNLGRAGWMLAQIKGGPSVAARTRVWAADMQYHGRFKPFLLLVGSLVGALLALRVTAIVKAKKATRVAQMYQSPEGKAAFAALKKTFSPKHNEYSECLKVLGLPAGATVRDIKLAYRTLVKEVHPDINKDNDPEKAARFISLTEKYERALDLRSELGLGE